MPGYGEEQMASGEKPSAMPRDAELGQMLEGTAKEAQEQIHFHRSQLGMWERVMTAAKSGLKALSADETADSEQDDHAAAFYRGEH